MFIVSSISVRELKDALKCRKAQDYVHIAMWSMCTTVAGERCIDAGDGGTLVWDPKVVENLTDEECKCIITRHSCYCTGQARKTAILKSL